MTEPSGRVLLAPDHLESASSQRSGTPIFFWILSVIAAIVGAGIGLLTAISATSVREKAAGAAIGLLIMLVSYVLARSVSALTRL